MTYRQTLQWLEQVHLHGVKLGLDNMRQLLAELGAPQLSPPSLLITGSNGKGSVTALAAAALMAAGHRVGVYTSPHLRRPEERIVSCGRPVSARRFAALASHVRTTIEAAMAGRRLERYPTYFECVTAMALVEFAQRRLDVSVLEVGLGGRFDATNAVEPLVSGITRIALEHTRYLGTTLAAIAREKVGIARPHRPLIVGTTRGEAHSTIRHHAERIGADLTVVSKAIQARIQRADRRGLVIDATTRRHHYRKLKVPFPGRHQLTNATVALGMLEALPDELRPTAEAITAGFAAAVWPGRLQYFPGTPRLLLDGAHNPDAAKALATYLQEFEPNPRKVLLLACLGDKDVPNLVRPLLGLFGHIVVTQVDNERSLTTDELAAILTRKHLDVHREPSPAAGLAVARKLAGRRGLVVVSGSLYLVGETLTVLDGEL